MTAVNVRESCVSSLPPPPDGGSWQGDTFFGVFGDTAIILSWLTNIVSTAAISYKAW